MQTVLVPLNTKRVRWLKNHLGLEIIKQSDSLARWTDPDYRHYYHEDVRELMLKHAGTDYETFIKRRTEALDEIKAEYKLLVQQVIKFDIGV